MLQLTAPDPEQIEVTLIGPSVGECVLLHFQGSWFVIDSCLDRATKLPAAQAYLQSINVSPEQVKAVVCTHWHDDHFKGFAQLYRWCTNAQLWMSGALRRREFIEAIEAWKDWPDGAEPHTSGLVELAGAVEEVKRRGSPPNFAVHDQRLWLAADTSAELWALSPSPAMIVKSFKQIASLTPTDWAQKNALVDSNQNHWAVAMHFRAGGQSVLLGSDLEEEGDPQTGWSAVIASVGRPQAAAGLYKVAHHGSETGHHDGIWASLLKAQPTSILTPFSRSNLPRPTDVERLKARSSGVYLTALKLPENKRQGAVAKATATKKLKPIDGPCGKLRARVNAVAENAQWAIEFDGPAGKV